MKNTPAKKDVTMYILVAVIIVAAFFLGSLYTKVQYLEKGGTQVAAGAPAQGAPNAAPSAAPQKVKMDVGHFPVLGNKNAKVTIVEFADLRCPFCEQFVTNTYPQLQKDYIDTGKVKFAFRQYAFLGPASTVAANAVECANDQGKFWDMHDYFYKNQPPETDTSMYTTDKLTQVAGTLGMNTDEFQSCLSSNKDNAQVNSDFTAGQQGGVTGTPTFFINGTPIVGAVPYDQLKTEIDAALKS
ncbi:MAG TPA: DsbA family protein [Patescibacteria group bacterium]|jgi:protein-disulfide isomerase|nr:DsbA family protein [Patescibacteria group bacterium]